MLIVTCTQMKEMESNSIKNGISSLRMMENAGSAAARYIRETVKISGKRCTVICGHGNNGGDGFVVARKLLEQGAKVTAIMISGSPKTAEASEMLDRLSARQGAHILSYEKNPECLTSMDSSDIIIDAVYGTGFHGTIRDDAANKAIDSVNSSGAKVFALDMPSGSNADTGEVSGKSVKADVTIAFAAPKIGQFLFPAANYCGKVVYVGIGLPESAYSVHGEQLTLIDGKFVSSKIPKRAKNSNKGDFGKVLCVCGSLGMAGAACMCATAALRCGAGLVTVMVPKSIYVPVASKLNECMVYPLEETSQGSISHCAIDKIKEAAQSASALVIGCGLSRNEETSLLVRELISDIKCPVILDADGINAFEGHIDLLRTSSSKLILTPHPGEMSRLCGKSISDIQSSRLDTAREFAKSNGVVVMLKGANTIVASPDGKSYVNPTGNPGMSKGGSGDILAGITASFAAQGMPADSAACCGAYIHGLAGDRTAFKLSQYGMIPTDMFLEIPQIFREMSR